MVNSAVADRTLFTVFLQADLHQIHVLAENLNSGFDLVSGIIKCLMENIHKRSAQWYILISSIFGTVIVFQITERTLNI